MTRVGQGKVVARRFSRGSFLSAMTARDVLTEEREILTVIKGGARTSDEQDEPPTPTAADRAARTVAGQGIASRGPRSWRRRWPRPIPRCRCRCRY